MHENLHQLRTTMGSVGHYIGGVFGAPGPGTWVCLIVRTFVISTHPCSRMIKGRPKVPPSNKGMKKINNPSPIWILITLFCQVINTFKISTCNYAKHKIITTSCNEDFIF